MKSLSEHLFSNEIFNLIMFADSEGPDQCAVAQSDLGLRCLHLPEDTFARGAA